MRVAVIRSNRNVMHSLVFDFTNDSHDARANVGAKLSNTMPIPFD